MENIFFQVFHACLKRVGNIIILFKDSFLIWYLILIERQSDNYHILLK